MLSSFFNSFFLISQFELKRLFLTRKGLLYLVTFAVVWSFILLYPIRFASEFLNQQKNLGYGNVFFEFIGFGRLTDWQIPEFGVYWRFALIMFPLLCIVISADQTCSDRVRGTLRFLTLRISRGGLFFGRFAGAMIIQVILIVSTLLTTLGLAISRDESLLAGAFNSSIAIIVNLFFVLLPFTAMMAVLSALVKSPKQSTTWAILIWSFLAGIISGLSVYIPALEILKILIPGYQMAELAQLSQWQGLKLAYVPLFQASALLTIGYWITLRQSL